MLFGILGVLALGLTGLTVARRTILFAVGSALAWLVLGVLMITNPDLLGLTSLSDNWMQILTFLCFAMVIGCFLWYISGIGKVKIMRTDREGQSWAEYGKPPRGSKLTRASLVKERHRERLRKIRK